MTEQQQQGMDFFHFKLPNLLVIAGSSQAGKSVLASKIVRSNREIIKPEPQVIIWVYTVWQEDLFAQLRAWIREIRFCNGLEEFQKIELSVKVNHLVVLDDCMTCVSDSAEMVELFTKKIHHYNIFLIYLTQSLYMRSKYNTTIQRQAGYIVLFQNRRNNFEATQLGRELNLTPTDIRYLYKDAGKYLKRPYILFVCVPETDDQQSMLIHFLPEQTPKFYYYINE
jgi:hypothetical protein